MNADRRELPLLARQWHSLLIWVKSFLPSRQRKALLELLFRDAQDFRLTFRRVLAKVRLDRSVETPKNGLKTAKSGHCAVRPMKRMRPNPLKNAKSLMN